MRELRDLLDFAHEKPSEPLVLCTIVRKSGSSYRDVGAKKLVALSGPSCGILSGGCLEAAIEKTALDGFSRMPFLESFSTASEEDRLLGYQTGCRGVIEILFELVSAPRDRAALEMQIPFGVPQSAALHAAPLPGSRRAPRAIRVSLSEGTLGNREITDALTPSKQSLIEPWIEPIALTVIGAGPDSVPYVDLARTLGWSLSFIDYRSDIASRMRERHEATTCIPASKIAGHVPDGPRSAVILATHNFEADLEILKNLSQVEVGYLGCIGPRERYARLKGDLGGFHAIVLSPDWEACVHAPAGVTPRGTSPTEIALSVVAQIQDELALSNENPWTVILAAGASSRFGSPKALATLGAQTLIDRAVETARAFSGPRVLVVTGAHRMAIERHFGGAPGPILVQNDGWSRGLGSSLAAGLRAILEREPAAPAVIFLPVDQPLVTSSHLTRIARVARRSSRVALTSDAGVAGPPAAVPRRFFQLVEELGKSEIDRGLKAALDPSEWIGVSGPGELFDVDRPSDLGKDLGNSSLFGMHRDA